MSSIIYYQLTTVGLNHGNQPSLQTKIYCQAFLKMSRKKHFISPIFRGLKEGKSKTKSKNAFYRSSFNVSLL